MNSYVHIGLYNTLRSLGATEDQAQAAVVDLPAPQHLATKEDLLKAIGEVKTDLAVLKFAYGPIFLALLVKIAFFD